MYSISITAHLLWWFYWFCLGGNLQFFHENTLIWKKIVFFFSSLNKHLCTQIDFYFTVPDSVIVMLENIYCK